MTTRTSPGGPLQKRGTPAPLRADRRALPRRARATAPPHLIMVANPAIVHAPLPSPHISFSCHFPVIQRLRWPGDLARVPPANPFAPRRGERPIGWPASRFAGVAIVSVDKRRAPPVTAPTR